MSDTDNLTSIAQVAKSEGEITQAILDSMNVEQLREENKAALDALGGVQVLISRLGLDPSVGWSHDQVAKMREKYGLNSFPDAPLDSYWELLLESLSDGTLLILIAAATVSLVIGVLTEPDHGWIEGAAIFIAIFLVSNISAGNDYSKQLQFRALEHSSSNDDRTSVIRAGSIERVNPRDLVVGDVLVLQAGDQIPADCVLFDNAKVESNESSLTGEPDDVRKSRDTDPFLLSACLLTAGEDCKAVVIGIGIHSQWGKIKANLVTEAVNTPLQDKLEDMSKAVGKLGVIFAVGTFIALIVSIWARHNGEDVADRVIDAFIIAVTVVVVAIPEGLPLAVTIALAYSTKKMYQDQCFIRVLAACETMGNATNICSDKTGTLTENRMTVVEGWFADTRLDQDEFPNAPIASNVKQLLADHISVNRSAYLVYKDQNGDDLDRPIIIGNKTEGALIMMVNNWGFQHEKIKSALFKEGKDKVFNFNSEKKRSTAVITKEDDPRSARLYCKGASEWILKDCSHHIDAHGNVVELTVEKKKQLEEHIRIMAENALRTLCVAHRDFDSANPLPANWQESPPDNVGLVLDCIVGIIDPLRPDVKEAVRIAQEAGVTVRMVTGDNLNTAAAIARRCGILDNGGLSMEGPDFRNLTPKELDERLPYLRVLARSSPDDKFLLVTRLNGYGLPTSREEWEKKFAARNVSWDTDRDRLLPGYREEWEESRPSGGQVVGVTGDGTNDAPALKAADVGLAMGITGTKVAQSAADIVILDDKFSSIVKAISWGRCVYDNIRKFLQFQLTVNVVALFLVFISAVIGFEVPLNAVQLLWVNLVMDTMGALALGTEVPTSELLRRRPYKRSTGLISRPMLRNILAQSCFQLALLFVLLFKGAAWFNVAEGNACLRYKVKSNSSMWDLSTEERDSVTGTFGCSDFDTFCRNDGHACFHDTHDFNGVPVNMSDLSDFAEKCLECKKLDYTHYSIIFNAFIFCQFFNEITSRSIGDKWNVFSGLFSNGVFIVVLTITLGCQIFLIEVGDEFLKTSPLNVDQWLITIALGAIGIPIGIMMRFIPVQEDPDSFFVDSSGTYTVDRTQLKVKKATPVNGSIETVVPVMNEKQVEPTPAISSTGENSPVDGNSPAVAATETDTPPV